jgi:hypothetical protein
MTTSSGNLSLLSIDLGLALMMARIHMFPEGAAKDGANNQHNSSYREVLGHQLQGGKKRREIQ